MMVWATVMFFALDFILDKITKEFRQELRRRNLGIRINHKAAEEKPGWKSQIMRIGFQTLPCALIILSGFNLFGEASVMVAEVATLGMIAFLIFVKVMFVIFLASDKAIWIAKNSQPLEGKEPIFTDGYYRENEEED